MEIQCCLQIFTFITSIINFFIEGIQGYDNIWILGDEFVTKAIGHLLDAQTDKDKEDKLYMKRNYNIKPYMDNNLSVVKSPVTRIRNKLVDAIHENGLFPKLILILIDTDLTCDIDSHISFTFGSDMNWLLTEIDKLLEIHKDRLPCKGRKPGYPTFVWMSPPQHKTFNDNDIRAKIDKVLRNSINARKNHTMMRMKKYWDYNDLALVKGKGFSSYGWDTFWMSIDSAVQFWDRHLAPKSLGFTHLDGQKVTEDPMEKFFNKETNNLYYGKGFGRMNNINHQGGFQKKKNNKFHWNKHQQEDLRMKLPKPPTKQS